MSWSLQLIGSPTKVAAALENYGEKINKDPDNATRREFEDVKPALLDLLKSYAEAAKGTAGIVKLLASGSVAVNLGGGIPKGANGSWQVTVDPLVGFCE